MVEFYICIGFGRIIFRFLGLRIEVEGFLYRSFSVIMFFNNFSNIIVVGILKFVYRVL